MPVTADLPQRMTRAILFCDVTDSTAQREAMGEVDADAWFLALSEHLSVAVLRNNGDVVKWLGDGLMAVFASAGEALDGAVAMQQGAFEHDREHGHADTGLRVGIAIGDVTRNGTDWQGMPAIVAARLCTAATPRQILATELVTTLAGNRLQHPITPAGEFSLKGIANAVCAVDIGWEPPDRPTRAHLAHALTTRRTFPFAGRNELVDDLSATWRSRAWRGLLVGGEPGIGKTRLVAELAAYQHRTGATVLFGRCDEHLSVAYRPWTEALGPIVTDLRPHIEANLAERHLAELRRLFPELGGALDHAETIDDGDARHALLADAVGALLDAVGCTCIVLDDIQWIDERSAQLTRHILLSARPDVSIVCTFRDTAADSTLITRVSDFQRIPGVRRVDLRGVDLAAVVSLIEESETRSQTGVTLADALHRRTAGNPLFLSELLRDMVDGAANNGLPEGLRTVIARRIGRLDDDTVEVLRIAAVSGSVFVIDIIERVLGSERGVDIVESLEQAERAGIISESGDDYEFRHAVIRDVLTDQMSSRRRRTLHTRIAAELEQWSLADKHLLEITFHHVQAKSPSAPLWCLRAARAAIADLDTHATDHAERGLELVHDDNELRCDLLIALATGRRIAMVETLPDARNALDAALELGDQQRIAGALLSVVMRPMIDDHVEHIEFLRAGLRHLTDTSLIARWQVETAVTTRTYLSEDSDPSEQLGQIDAIVAHLDLNDPASCRVALRCARSLTSTNQPHRAREIASVFVVNSGGYDTEGVPADLMIATTDLHLGNRDGFDRHLDVALDSPRRRHWFIDCHALQQVAMRQLLDGAWDAAEETIDRITVVGGHDADYILSSSVQRHWLLRETGDTGQSYAMLREYQVGSPGLTILGPLLASDAAEAGFVDEASDRLDALAPDDFAAAGRGWLTLLAMSSLAWAAVTVDAPRHASSLSAILAPYRGQMAVIATGTHVVSAVDRLSAGLADLDGRFDESDALFAEALAIERQVRSLPLEARTLHWWGRAMMRRGETGRGAKMLDRAHRIAADLRMSRLVAQIEVDATTAG